MICYIWLKAIEAAISEDSLPPVDSHIIRQIISEELCGGGDLKELLRDFQDEALGTASIAQVPF